jgi:hypothetical protein
LPHLRVNGQPSQMISGMTIKLPSGNATLSLENSFEADGFVKYTFEAIHENAVFNGDMNAPNDYTIEEEVFKVSVSVHPSEFATQFFRLDVSVPPSLTGGTYGFLGDNDGNPANDLIASNGVVYSLTPGDQNAPKEYAESWMVSEQTSLFVYDAGFTTSSYIDLDFEPSAIADFSDSEVAGALAYCEDPVLGIPDDSEMLQNACVMDVLFTGSFDTSLVSAYSQLALTVARSEAISPMPTPPGVLEEAPVTDSPIALVAIIGGSITCVVVAVSTVIGTVLYKRSARSLDGEDTFDAAYAFELEPKARKLPRDRRQSACELDLDDVGITQRGSAADLVKMKLESSISGKPQYEVV